MCSSSQLQQEACNREIAVKLAEAKSKTLSLKYPKQKSMAQEVECLLFKSKAHLRV
jgi:hypothetical protein